MMNIIKRIVCALLCAALLLSMAACGSKKTEPENSGSAADPYLQMAEEFMAIKAMPPSVSSSSCLG